MIDIKLIREQPDKVKFFVAKKLGKVEKVDEALALDSKRKTLLIQIEDLRGKRNKLEKNDMEMGKKIKEELKALEPELKEVEEKLYLVMRQIPNAPLDDVPEGKDDSENVVIRTWGTPKEFDFQPRDHLELGEILGVIDMETAGKVSGARFGYIMGDLALMEMALVQYAFKKLAAKGFIPVIPPVMIKPDVYIKMARLDPGQEEERYYMPKDDIYLVGSAEHTMGPMHMDQTLEEKNLPIRYIGFSSAFRREAGSYGKDTRGMLRVHQFDKVEMECFTLPEEGVKEQDFLVSIQEEVMQDLNLPYQVMNVCTGDMGGPDARQIDINTWMPAQNKYRETHSADYMSDYQSRRLETRVKRKDGKMEFVHMNDATCIAVGRTLIAIMENYQNADGSVTIPEVLRPYMGKDKIEVKK
jgi:seryl-tRNA synthetase